MTDDSIDFQLIPDDVPVRRSFRVPISQKDNIQAIFQGQTYAVADISAMGIAIHAKTCLEFEPGQVVENAELWLGTQHLNGLTGKVVHCSVSASGALCFGIAWMCMTTQNQAILNQALAQLKTLALNDGDRENNDQEGHD